MRWISAAVKAGTALLTLHIREMTPFGDVPYIEGPQEAQQLMQELMAELPMTEVSIEKRIDRPALNPVPEDR